MGRPRKLNLSENLSDYSHVSICVTIFDYTPDCRDRTCTTKTFYTDSTLFSLPAPKVISAQIAAMLNKPIEDVIITSITI